VLRSSVERGEAVAEAPSEMYTSAAIHIVETDEFPRAECR